MTASDGLSRKESLTWEFSNWLHSLAPWELFFTGTFSYEASNESCQRSFKSFMNKYMSDVSWFYVTEKNPNRPGYHIHALIHGAEGYSRKTIWNKWFKRFGINKLEPVRSRMKVEKYTTKHCTTYLTKGFGWYDLKINDPNLWNQSKR